MNFLDVNFPCGFAPLRSLLTWVKTQDLFMSCKLRRLERCVELVLFRLFFAALSFALLHRLFYQVQIDSYFIPNSLLGVDPP